MGEMDQPPIPPRIEIAAKQSGTDKKKQQNNSGVDMSEDEIRRALERMVEDRTPPDKNSFFIDIGQVSMMVPKTWTKGLYKKSVFTYRNYYIAGDKDAPMSFYYRGQRCSQRSGDEFKKALKRPPHELTDAEVHTLYQVLDRFSRDFTKSSMRTEDLKGKRVIIVEGIYDKGKPEEQLVKEILIASDDTGTAVQEVYYQAKPEAYRRHLQEAEKAFKSIIWR